VCVSLGFGKLAQDVNPAKIEMLSLHLLITGFASILATTWSKTSFAVTILRISDGWIKKTIWFIIISVNIVWGINGTIHWMQCWPSQRIWRPSVDGTCLPKALVINYNVFAAGMFLSDHLNPEHC
jgi:hypothetical protein